MINKLNNQEGKSVLIDVEFPIRRNSKWEKMHAVEIFKDKKVVVFSLPGAFTPTCSTSHLPRYEELYDTFKANGIDEVYCLSVNDTFVMNEWAKAQQIENVKMLPDGNAKFTKAMEMLVDKEDLGFGQRSWRYSMLIDNGKVIKHFIEPDKEGDPFEVSDADTMIKYINPEVKLPDSITIFTKEGCEFCTEAKSLLKDNGFKYNEIVLGDALRQKVLSGLTGKGRSTAPQIFMNGQLIGGTEQLKAHLNVK